jgi:hypothetical protein
MIQFPFWLLTPAGPTTGESRLPLAFSSVERMSEVQSHGGWAVQLVNRYTVAEVLAHLNANGVRVVRYDVSQDGSGDVEAPLDQITAARLAR